MALALTAARGAPARGDDPRPRDFAYGIEMRPRGDAPLLLVRLPLDVYREITRTDLGDLRVFNADAELVPHELWQQAAESRSETRTFELHLFPLLESTPAALAAVRVRIERGAGSTSFDVAPEASAPPRRVAAYVLDRGAGQERARGLERLRLEWRTAEQSFVANVRVEASDDLESWSPAGQGVLAELDRDGERRLRDDLRLEGPSRRYLRVLPTGGALPVALEGAWIERTSTSELAALSWLGAEATADGGELHFELPGPLFVEAVEVVPGKNTWTTASLFSRSERERAWTRRASGPIYDLAVDGERVAVTRLDVGGSRDRFWKIATDDAGGGFGATAPRLQVGYRPDELVFVARGEAPFTLAYGSGSVGRAPPASASLRELADRSRPIEPSDDVALGRPTTLSGQAALAKPRVSDWKRLLLWGALGLAAVVLLLTARAALASGAGLGGSPPDD